MAVNAAQVLPFSSLILHVIILHLFLFASEHLSYGVFGDFCKCPLICVHSTLLLQTLTQFLTDFHILDHIWLPNSLFNKSAKATTVKPAQEGRLQILAQVDLWYKLEEWLHRSKLPLVNKVSFNLSNILHAKRLLQTLHKYTKHFVLIVVMMESFENSFVLIYIYWSCHAIMVYTLIILII